MVVFSETVNHFCDVIDADAVLSETFTIECSSAPADGEQIQYVVVNLPMHVPGITP
jgi:hypothetical protein